MNTTIQITETLPVGTVISHEAGKRLLDAWIHGRQKTISTQDALDIIENKRVTVDCVIGLSLIG